jgi:hypothetical protein
MILMADAVQQARKLSSELLNTSNNLGDFCRLKIHSLRYSCSDQVQNLLFGFVGVNGLPANQSPARQSLKNPTNRQTYPNRDSAPGPAVGCRSFRRECSNSNQETSVPLDAAGHTGRVAAKSVRFPYGENT